MLNKTLFTLLTCLFFQGISAQTEFSFVKLQPERIADTISSNELGTTTDWGGVVEEPIIGQVVYAPEDTMGSRLLCDTPIVDFTDKIVLIDRGECFFTSKAFQAQQLGAVGVIIRNDTNFVVSMGSPPSYIGNVTIPVVMIPDSFGIEIEESLVNEDTVIVGFIPAISTKVITLQKEVNLQVYPNPMNHLSWFDLKGIQVEKGILQLFDMMGREVRTKPFFQNKFQLGRYALPSGTYFFKISVNRNSIAATGMLQVID